MNFTIEIHCFSQMIHQIRQNRIPCSNVVRLQKFSIKFFGLWIIVKSERNLVKFNAERSLIHPVTHNIFDKFSFVLPSFVIENVFLLNAVLNKPE